jgi:hypothetical protein
LIVNHYLTNKFLCPQLHVTTVVVVDITPRIVAVPEKVNSSPLVRVSAVVSLAISDVIVPGRVMPAMNVVRKTTSEGIAQD